MSGEGTPPAPQNLDDLPALALSRPHEALTLARTLLANHPSSRVAAAAHHAIGVVLREFGAIDEALAEFRTGMHRARQATDIARVADIRASYGVALLLAGRTRRGLAEIEAAAGDAVGEAAGRIEVRRAYGLLLLGDYREMLRAAQRAVVLLAHGDPVWEARAHNHRAVAHLALGAVALADRDYARAEELFARAGQRLEYAIARHDRAVAAFARGDLPAALTLLDDAQRVIDELDVFEPDLSITRAQVLLAAGLDRDALRVADEGVARSERLRGSAMRRGELLFVAAMAARAGGDVATAAERSREALRMFRRQQRPRWAARAELVLLESRFDGGETSPELLRKADRLAGTLERLALTGALEAHVLAGRIALACGKDDVGARHLRAAAARRPRDLRARATGWLARAVLAEAEARPADLLAACARGLDLVDAHLRTLGATELRAQATAQGADLARLALRQAAQAGDARRLLQWSERWRATALAAPPVRLDPDAEMTRDLAVLRSLARRLESAQAGDPAIPVLLQERRRLEEAVRRQALRQPGGARGRTASIRLGELRDLLGDATLVELTDVGGELFAITLAGRRPPAMHHVGGVAAADRVLAHALFALRRGATRRSTAPLDLRPIGERLQATMLGPVASTLRAPAVVVVPTGRLHAVPWNLLPALRGRAVTVAPSVAAWIRGRRAAAPVERRVVLVGGPRLSTGATEVRRLAERYPDAEVLAEGGARSDRVLAAMDGAWLVHVAAHGTFRADSPLLSALELDDGPLTVYDLERLGRGPHRVVLSSCNSAVGAPSGADELLGVASAFISLGTAGVVASVVPVDDPSTVPFMLELHRHMAEATLAEALAVARRAVGDDPTTLQTADSFIALGA